MSWSWLDFQVRATRNALAKARDRVSRTERELSMRCSFQLENFLGLQVRLASYHAKNLAYLESLDAGEIDPMSTKYPELFAALSEEFGPREVRTRPQGKTQISYITARTVMNRLDSVLGPENWWDKYTPQPTCVICELTIRLPDGSTLTKADAGGHAGMSDEGDDEKSCYSDAFKRAAVKFGIGRHLYRDGTPQFIAPPQKRSDGTPQTTKEFCRYLRQIDPTGEKGHIEFLKAKYRKQGWPDLISEWSDAQAREAYPVLQRQIKAEASLEPATA